MRGWRVRHLFPREQAFVWRESLAVGLAVDHYLVVDVGEPIEGAVAEDGGVEQTEPLLGVAVAGD